jgi:hypothetical protein
MLEESIQDVVGDLMNSQMMIQNPKSDVYQQDERNHQVQLDDIVVVL